MINKLAKACMVPQPNYSNPDQFFQQQKNTVSDKYSTVSYKLVGLDEWTSGWCED